MSDVQCQMRLANPARTGEGEEAYLRTAQLHTDFCYLLLASNERGERHREMSRKSCGALDGEERDDGTVFMRRNSFLCLSAISLVRMEVPPVAALPRV